MSPYRLRVASDVGGTFTDNLAYDEAAKRVTVTNPFSSAPHPLLTQIFEAQQQ